MSNDLLFSPSSPCHATVFFMNRRWKSRRPSKFPKEGGLERKEAEHKKLNPLPPKWVMDMYQVPPENSGSKHDSIGSIMNEYIPNGESTYWEAAKSNIKSLYSIIMIKWKDPKKFKVREFAQIAQKSYIDFNNDLQIKDGRKSLHLRMQEVATLNQIRVLQAEFENNAKTIYWRFMKETKKPQIVTVSYGSLDEENTFAQVTVKMCISQILAVRDCHHRLVSGSLRKPVQTIDYVVFERDITDPYGGWRICGKVTSPSAK